MLLQQRFSQLINERVIYSLTEKRNNSSVACNTDKHTGYGQIKSVRPHRPA